MVGILPGSPLWGMFGGEERDETEFRVELTLELAGAVEKIVFSVLSGVASHLPALVGRETMESKGWVLRCRDRVLETPCVVPLTIDASGHYVFVAKPPMSGQASSVPNQARTEQHTSKRKIARLRRDADASRSPARLFSPVLLVMNLQVLVEGMFPGGLSFHNPFHGGVLEPKPLKGGHRVLLASQVSHLQNLRTMDLYPDVIAHDMSFLLQETPCLESDVLSTLANQSSGHTCIYMSEQDNLQARKAVCEAGHAFWFWPTADSRPTSKMRLFDLRDLCLKLESTKRLQRTHADRLHVNHDDVIVRDSLDRCVWTDLPHVYSDSKRDDIIQSTLPLNLVAETLLQGVLDYLTHGLDARRVDLGVTQLCEELEFLLAEGPQVPTVSQRTNIGTAKSMLLGAYTARGCGIAIATQKFGHLLPLIHGLAKLRPSVEGAEYRYMSISVNQGSVNWHRDLRNRRWSWSISLGQYRGGNLLVKKEHEKKALQVSSWRKWVLFDPRCEHKVLPITQGARWSLTLYTPRDYRQLNKQHVSSLHDLGFPVTGMLDCLLVPDPDDGSKQVLASEAKRPRLQVDYDPERFYADTPPDSPREVMQDDADELPDAGSPVTYGPEEVPVGFRMDSAQHEEKSPEFALPGVVHEHLMGNGETNEPEEAIAQAASLPNQTPHDRTAIDLPPPLKGSELSKTLARLHADLGHPPPHLLARALALFYASDSTVQAALEHVCPVCESRRTPSVTPAARLPTAQAFNDELGVDKCYDTLGQVCVVLNVVDIFTGYQVTVPLGRVTPSAAACWNAFVRGWVQPLGKPALLKCDNGPEFGAGFMDGAMVAGIQIRANPRWYPQHNSVAERRGGFAKWVAQAAMLEANTVWHYEEGGAPSVSDATVAFWGFLQHTVNNYVHDSGYSSAQLAFGAGQRLPLSLMSGRARVEIASRARDDGAVREQFWHLPCIRRAAAASQVNSRLGRVLASRPRGSTTVEPASSAPGLEPGAQVYIFHHPNPRKHAKRWWTERWVGPALVVSSEKNAIWVIFRRRLLKVAKTHIRPVSDLERVDWSSLVESASGAAGGNKGAGQSSWHHPSSSD
eukprot:6456381-Amphidinium_carterae.2